MSKKKDKGKREAKEYKGGRDDLFKSFTLNAK
jgi:hypothetical protein